MPAKPEYHHFECDCHSDEHVIRFIYDPDDKEIILCYFLDQYNPWYRRIWIGLKYICGYKCKYGHFDCTILRPVEILRLFALLSRASGYTKYVLTNGSLPPS